MEALWFVILVFMLAMYVILDGFDFGTGIVYLWVARSEPERRRVLASIGPVWNGNEVWLIAAGGLLFFAFPRAYAAGFSGFYLALIIVLWLFMLRGLSLELRSHVDHPLWRALWDVGFAVSSTMLAIVFGAALGNLLRGVPLSADGYFFTALWTDWSPGPEPGILDWFTVLVAATTAAIVALHGSYYVVMKTTGALAVRARRVARLCQGAVLLLVGLSVIATVRVQPLVPDNFVAHPAGLLLPVLAIGGAVLAVVAGRREWDVIAFASSSAMIFGLLCSAALGLFPNLLVASGDPTHSLTIYNAATSPHGLRIGLRWFSISMVLVVVYSWFVHRLFWGKVEEASLPEPH